MAPDPEVPHERLCSEVSVEQGVALHDHLRHQTTLIQSTLEQQRDHRNMLVHLQETLDQLLNNIKYEGCTMNALSSSQAKFGPTNMATVDIADCPIPYLSEAQEHRPPQTTVQVEPISDGDIGILGPSDDAAPHHDQDARTFAHNIMENMLGCAQDDETLSGERKSTDANVTKWATFRHVVLSGKFEAVIGVVILLNAVAIAADMHNAGLHIGWEKGFVQASQPPDLQAEFLVLNYILLSCFVVELVLKVLVLKLRFFASIWNWIDLITVAFGIGDAFNLLVIGIDATLLRLLRLTKLARYLKLGKSAAWLDILRLIIKSIAGSLGTVGWSLLLLFGIQTVAGMVVGQMVIDYVSSEHLPFQVRKEIYVHWGTMSRLICTMFEVTFVNANTPAIRALMDHVDLAWGAFFILYRLSVNFVLLSVIRAVIVKQTFTIAEQDAELLLSSATKSDSSNRCKLMEVFTRLDTSNDGSVSRDEMDKFLQDKQVIMVLKTMGVHVSQEDSSELFDLLDNDKSGHVDFDEILRGVTKMRGPAMSADMQQLLAKVEQIRVQVCQS